MPTNPRRQQERSEGKRRLASQGASQKQFQGPISETRPLSPR